MKKITLQLLGLVISVMLFGACSQTATFENEDLLTTLEKGQAGFNLTPYGTGGTENAKTYASNSWETGCVPGNGTFANGDFFERAFTPVLVQWGGPSGTANSKTGNLTVYNTATKFVFRISSTVAISDLLINDVSQAVGTPANTVLTHEIDLPANWKAGDDYVFTVKYTGGGPAIEFPQTTYEYVGICTTTTLSAGTTEDICEGTEFNLTAAVSTAGANFEGGYIQILNSSNVVVATQLVTLTDKDVTYSVPTGTAGQYTYSARYVRVDPTFRYQGSVSAGTSTVGVIDCGCENEMTADLTCSATNTVVFTFYAEEAGPVVIQGGLNANASITSASAVGVDQVIGHPSTNGKADVTRWAGDVDACEEVTVTVSWTGPATVGDWSAKRGDVTLAEVLGSSVTCD